MHVSVAVDDFSMRRGIAPLTHSFLGYTSGHVDK
jgi:hypothetical protein